MKNTDTSPWYKQFWPWFLITIPALSMVLSITMLNLALNTDDSLVADEYYKEGKGINLQLAKVEAAKRLGMKTQLTVNDRQIAIEFVAGAPKTGEALALTFYHPTLQSRDFQLLLTQDARGIYRGTAEQDISGKWKLTLAPLNDDWKIVNELAFPRQAGVAFNP